jgi:hypothetical protein
VPIEDDKRTEYIPLADRELYPIEQVADVWGVSIEEAASRLGSMALARRIKTRTGETKAPVYDISKRRKKEEL